MNKKFRTQNLMNYVAVVAMSYGLAACVLGSQVVDHSFGFDANSDSPDVYVLDYRYGDSQLPMARNPESLLKQGKSLQSTNINGAMRRGESLYVKWRIKSTNEVFEDTVDLRHRLPSDLEDHRIYFVIEGKQLYVYLISPKRRPPEVPRNGPEKYSYLVVKTVYPDPAKR